ncbi:hypothetical protein ACWIUD_08980 [Helicobacter sp. 23-1044]
MLRLAIARTRNDEVGAESCIKIAESIIKNTQIAESALDSANRAKIL